MIVIYRGFRLIPARGGYMVTFLHAQRTRYGTLEQCKADVDAREALLPFPDNSPAFA